MNDPDAAPGLVQVLQDQTSVTMLGLGLAAQQHGWDPEEVSIQRLLHTALPYKPRKVPRVSRPSYASVPVSIEHLPGRCKPGFVEVLGAAEFLQEKWEIGAPGKPGELGGVVQPHVEEALDPGPL